MTIHLPEELKCFLRTEVESGRFASEDEAIFEALRLLQQRQQEIPVLSKHLTEEEFEQRLSQTGFATIPAHPVGSPISWDFQPIKIKGEPLSDTVIRERR